MEYNEIVEKTLKRALKAESLIEDSNVQISKWSLEQAILNRQSVSVAKAALEWLKSFLADALLEDDDGIKVFMKKHRI